MAFDLKDYVDVAERLREFYKENPTGRIITTIVEMTDKRVVVKAEAFRKSDTEAPSGVGHSQMSIPGSTTYTRGSELENAETSAVGRALVMAGLASKRIASADEVAGRSIGQGYPATPAQSPGNAPRGAQDAPGALGGTPGGSGAESAALGQGGATSGEMTDGDWVRTAAAVFDAPPPAPAQAPTGPAPVCDEHGLEMRFRPAGVSQRTGKPYTAFWGCQERGCKITARA